MEAKARVAVLTTRNSDAPGFMSMVYDFEDTIVRLTGAELISLDLGWFSYWANALRRGHDGRHYDAGYHPAASAVEAPMTCCGSSVWGRNS